METEARDRVLLTWWRIAAAIYACVVVLGVGYRLYIAKEPGFLLGHLWLYFSVAILFACISRFHRVMLDKWKRTWEEGEENAGPLLMRLAQIPVNVLGGSAGILIGLCQGIPLATVSVPPILAVLANRSADDIYWTVLSAFRLGFLPSILTSLLFLVLVYVIGTVIIHFSIRATLLQQWTKDRESLAT